MYAGIFDYSDQLQKYTIHQMIYKYNELRRRIDKVFGNLKSSFIINPIILNKVKEVIYMNRRTDKELHLIP